MASREPRQNTARAPSGASGTLSRVLPFDVRLATSLSWELGDRLAREDCTPRVASFENPVRNTSLTVFEATDHTRLVRVRTPVGREKFFGVARRDVDFESLCDGSDWRAVARST